MGVISIPFLLQLQIFFTEFRMQSFTIVMGFVLAFTTSIMAFSEPVPECKCSGLTTRTRGRIVGDCETTARMDIPGGHLECYWCYVDARDDCIDRVESKTTRGLYYSFDACKKKLGNRNCVDHGAPASEP